MHWKHFSLFREFQNRVNRKKSVWRQGHFFSFFFERRKRRKSVAEIQQDFKSRSHGAELTEAESVEMTCGAKRCPNGLRFHTPVMSVQCFDDTFCGKAHNEGYQRGKQKRNTKTNGCHFIFKTLA